MRAHKKKSLITQNVKGFKERFLITNNKAPCSFIMIRTPWKNPLNLGLAERWSFINFTFKVSIGVTAKIASDTPAPKPHNNRFPGERFPWLSILYFLSSSNAPNLSKYKQVTIIYQGHYLNKLNIHY